MFILTCLARFCVIPVIKYSIFICSLFLLFSCTEPDKNGDVYKRKVISINDEKFHLGMKDDIEKISYSDSSGYTLNDCVSAPNEKCSGIGTFYKINRDTLGVQSCIILISKMLPECRLVGVELYIRKDHTNGFAIVNSSQKLVYETTDMMEINNKTYLHKFYSLPEEKSVIECISYCFWYERLDIQTRDVSRVD